MAKAHVHAMQFKILDHPENPFLMAFQNFVFQDGNLGIVWR